MTTLEVTPKHGKKWQEQCKNDADAEGYAIIIWHSHPDSLKEIKMINEVGEKVLYSQEPKP